MTTARLARLEARVSAEQKQLMQRAATLAGETLTQFVVGSAQRAAEQTIREHDVLLLTAQESRRFVEVLLDPPAPAAALRAAVAHYQRVLAPR